MIDSISHARLRARLREEGVSSQVLQASNDPDFEVKKNRIPVPHAIADRRAVPGKDDPMVIICMDEFGPLNLQPNRASNWPRSRPKEVTPQLHADVVADVVADERPTRERSGL